VFSRSPTLASELNMDIAVLWDITPLWFAIYYW